MRMANELLLILFLVLRCFFSPIRVCVRWNSKSMHSICLLWFRCRNHHHYHQLRFRFYCRISALFSPTAVHVHACVCCFHPGCSLLTSLNRLLSACYSTKQMITQFLSPARSLVFAHIVPFENCKQTQNTRVYTWEQDIETHFLLLVAVILFRASVASLSPFDSLRFFFSLSVVYTSNGRDTAKNIANVYAKSDPYTWDERMRANDFIEFWFEKLQADRNVRTSRIALVSLENSRKMQAFRWTLHPYNVFNYEYDCIDQL